MQFLGEMFEFAGDVADGEVARVQSLVCVGQLDVIQQHQPQMVLRIELPDFSPHVLNGETRTVVDPQGELRERTDAVGKAWPVRRWGLANSASNYSNVLEQSALRVKFRP